MKSITYTLGTTATASKVTPQINQILEVLREDTRDTWTSDEIEQLLDGANKITTKQAPYRIFLYYRKAMIDAGMITMDVIKTTTTKDKSRIEIIRENVERIAGELDRIRAIRAETNSKMSPAALLEKIADMMTHVECISIANKVVNGYTAAK